MTPNPDALLRTEPCAECGARMLWTQNAWAHDDNRAAAYQCPNGHVLDPRTTRQCPQCGVHDTYALATEAGTFECTRCRHRFIVSA
jgi:endogenous inhibitor of DNA gyrase (YacG/DUF329 family)